MTVLEMIQKYYPSVWSKEKVDDLLKNNKITVANYLTVFPITDDNPVTDEMREMFRSAKLAELSAICNTMIESGIDVQTTHSGEETEHFSLDSYAQSNITNMFYSVMAGVEEYPYHADGKECTTYTKADIVNIYVATQSTITYHTTLNNMLHALVNRTNDVDSLAAITYETKLPDDLAATMQTNIEKAQTQIQKVLSSLG